MYFVGATTNATISKTHDIYLCNFAWLGLLFAAALSILLTGVASLVLKHKTLGPEMFGFVTSMTYENSYLNVPKGGSMLDAMERARLLKDVEVHIGDVRANEDVGHIAFAAGAPKRKLERGRLYY
jgi:predicted outer membrane lipoprotein